MHIDIKEKLQNNSLILESEFSKYLNEEDKDISLLTDSQRYSILGGGKRIRAFLVIEFAKLFGAEINSALPYACAIEMVHTSSLIHDDLPCMDDDSFRRGKPSNHKVYGENIALLAGDALLAKAFEITASNPHLSPKQNLQAVEIIATHTGSKGMLAGQTIDVFAANNQLDRNTIIKLHNFKTGKLIIASTLIGCIAAGLDKDSPQVLAAIEYSSKLGLAFQIVDDILDYEEGKREMNSFLSFMNLDEAKSYAQHITNEAINAIIPYDDGTFVALAKYLIERKF